MVHIEEDTEMELAITDSDGNIIDTFYLFENHYCKELWDLSPEGTEIESFGTNSQFDNNLYVPID